MDNQQMILRLKKAGIRFAQGMTEEELSSAERFFGVRFPEEIRAFLACGRPVGKGFFDWRDLSDENLHQFRGFREEMENAFLFDLEHCREELKGLLGEPFSRMEGEELDRAVLDYLHRSTKLIPFYGHRCFFDGLDGKPILSFWQPVDTIVYGQNWENYLETEFLGLMENDVLDKTPLEGTGIWYDLVEEVE